MQAAGYAACLAYPAYPANPNLFLPERCKRKMQKKIIDVKTHIRKRSVKTTISILVVIIMVVVVVCTIMYSTIENNVATRVKDESQFLAEQQAESINKAIDEQYNIVQSIASMIEGGMSFSDEADQAVLKILVEKNTLCMLAYADKDGNVMDYQGEVFGNASDRAYFSDVISGKKKFACQYLPTAGEGNEPRVIFSTAVHSAGEITGVVFISKEIDVLGESLFQQSMFNAKDCSVIVDGTGDILVRNNQAEKEYGNTENISEILSDSSSTDLCWAENGSTIIGENNDTVMACSSIGQNDWHLVCLIDMDTARQQYASNLIAIRHLVFVSSLCFILAGAYFICLALLQVRESKENYKISRTQYNRVLQLLQKMKCNIFDYDVKTGKIESNDLFREIFELDNSDNLWTWIEKGRVDHQEFDFDGLIREAKYAIRSKETVSMGSIYQTQDASYKMISVVMMPITDSNGCVTNILGCVKESSEEHQQLKQEVDMFNQIPGGIYRSYLGNPIHVDYVGERLCEMLGYSPEEFNSVTGRHYINIILDEDREKYIEFVREAAKEPCVRKCQYRLCCKNGETLSVLETMETLKNDSGSVYGYSVVVDVTEYEKRQRINLQEIRQLEENLETLRIRNSASQMQPHFLYNALSSIREVVLQNPQYASDLLYDFTVYLRACIRTMEDGALVSIQQEMDNIRAYVNIEKMRMGERLTVEYDLKSEDFEIVPLSIQPLVENAIRHGIYRRGKQGGNVRISTETFPKCHVITVRDNGVGFDYQKLRDEVEAGNRDSIGLDNVTFRLTKQVNGKVIIRSQVGEGTVIMIRIPREDDPEKMTKKE